MDGKYIKVAGFTVKTTVPLWHRLLNSHIIPYGALYPAEDYDAFLDFFLKLRALDYSPSIVVADDRAGLRQALNKGLPVV